MSRKSRMSKVRKSRRRRSQRRSNSVWKIIARACQRAARWRCPRTVRTRRSSASSVRGSPPRCHPTAPQARSPSSSGGTGADAPSCSKTSSTSAKRRKGERARPVRPHWSVEPETHSLWSRPLGAAARLAAAGLCPAVLARGTATQHRVPSSGSELGANLCRGRPAAPVVLPWRGPGWARSTP